MKRFLSIVVLPALALTLGVTSTSRLFVSAGVRGNCLVASPQRAGQAPVVSIQCTKGGADVRIDYGSEARAEGVAFAKTSGSTMPVALKSAVTAPATFAMVNF